LEKSLGEERMAGPDGALVRGAHWRNFLAKYAESNRMHKKMQALSFLCRERGDPPAARRAIGRAQCNDAYWHGVFGGLYLPHLREAIWRNLALAEAELRSGEPLAAEVLDFDADGHEEVWIHSQHFSAVLSPRRGGAIEEYTVFAAATNYANTLTRRREAYHDTALQLRADEAAAPGGAPSIHDLEHGVQLDEMPALDAEPRAIFLERVIRSGVTQDEYAGGKYWPVRSWTQVQCGFTIERQHDSMAIVCSCHGQPGLEKRLEFAADGTIGVTFQWDPSSGDPDDLFTSELSLFAPLEIRSDPAAEEWSFPIETVAKSERGLDRTRQGQSVTLRWPVHLGEARLQLRPAGFSEEPKLETVESGAS
jgi:4-alpha-glucanotransferase